MKISRGWRLVIFLTAFYALFAAAMIYGDVRIRHNSSNLLLHLSILTNCFFLAGLIFWFGPRWKYFRITGLIVFLIGCVILAIHHWQKRDPWGYIFWPIWFLWGLYSLKEEIVKHMTHNDSQETSNDFSSSSEK
jgi:hypothetical protein